MKLSQAAAFLAMSAVTTASAFATTNHHQQNSNRNGVVLSGRTAAGLSSPAFVRPSSSALSASVVDTTVVSTENLAVLSERGREAILRLVENDTDGAQKHVYGDWPDAGVDDEAKAKLAEQVRNTHMHTPHYLVVYVMHHRAGTTNNNDTGDVGRTEIS